MTRAIVLLIVTVSVCAIGYAAEAPAAGRAACVGQDCARCHTLSLEEATEILRPLNVTVQSIKHAPIQGMFEVLAQRDEKQGLVYVDYAKKHIMQGIVVNVATREAISSHVKDPPALK